MSSNWIQDTCFAEKTGLSIGDLPKIESLISVIVASEAAESTAKSAHNRTLPPVQGVREPLILRKSFPVRRFRTHLSVTTL